MNTEDEGANARKDAHTILNLDENHENADWLKPGKGLPSDMLAEKSLKAAPIETPGPNASEHNEANSE